MQLLALLAWAGEQLALEFDGEGKRLPPGEEDPAAREPFIARASPMRRTMFDAGRVERPIDDLPDLKRAISKGG